MDLNEKRQKIDQIDEMMKELFLKRMQIVSDIALYKKEKGLAIFDKAREEEMKKRLAQELDEPLRSLYLAFLETTVSVSKEYQKIKINK